MGMTEEEQPKNESASPAITGGSEKASGDRSAWYVAMFLGCLVVALIVVVAVVIFNPTKEESPLGQLGSDLASGGTSPALPSGAAPRTVPESTVRLPTAAISATAEELQKEAETVVEALQQAHPDRPEALHAAAILASLTGRGEDAEKLWRRCIELNPKQATYYVSLAKIATDREDSQLAAETLQKAIDAGCASAEVYHRLAIVLTGLGRHEEAEGVIQKALAESPQSGAYLLVLGQAQLKEGKFAEAEASLRRAIESGLATRSGYDALAEACAKQNKDEDAAKFRELSAKSKTEAPVEKQEGARVLSTAEARRVAVTTLCEAAVAHGQLKDSLESERLLLRAVAIDPSSPLPCRFLASFYQGSGMFVEERAVWSRLVEIEPNEGGNYLMLAQSCAKVGDLESAEAALKLAMTMRPEGLEGYVMLARFHAERGDAGKARWFVQEALRREPSAEGYQFLARMCRMSGDEAGAKAAEANAQKLSPAAPAPQGESPKQASGPAQN